MTDAASIAQVDQGLAAAHDHGRLRGRFYQGAVEGGAPPLLAAVLTVIHAYGSDVVAEEHCCDCTE